jgi:MFS family permease
VALSNTTLGVLMATINSSIVLISLPAIFRGINIDPLTPQNVSYLLWMLMGYMVVMAVLVVSFGRIGDMFGRVRIYNLGFAVFTVASIALSLVLWQGSSAALALIGLRILQGVGGALLMANSAAILTDAFPPQQRGMALGINAVAAISGSFIGLIVGGLLSVVDWHLVFLVSVPVGVGGTLWAFFSLREIGVVRRSRIDWWGNLSFGFGLVAILVGITYGIQPYGGKSMGWTNPMVLGLLAGGTALTAVFVFVEGRVANPMFRLGLFRVPAFTAGNLAGLLASIGRGGLMFMLIIWLQGIWLPLHGYDFEQTPLWSAIYMLPLTAGFLIAGPLSGYLSDRFGPRPFATGGMIAAAATFGLMRLLPANFAYLPFALLLLGNGLAMGLFSSPNTAGIMNSVPPAERGVASGMRATFQNAGMNLSIGLFFSLMIAGLSARLPEALLQGLTSQGVPGSVADRIAQLPPVGSLFAAFLGYNPMQSLLGPVLQQLPADKAGYLTGHTFFPNLISAPFMHGMHVTFIFALVMMLVAALASWLRGKRYVYEEAVRTTPAAGPAVQAAGETSQPPAESRPLVAISASYGAGGSEIGRAAASRLGVPCVDPAVPASAADRVALALGEARALSEAVALQGALALRETPADETAVGRLFPLLLELGAASQLFGIQGTAPSQVFVEEGEYVTRVREAIEGLAATTGAVIIGHGATVLLRGRAHALCVRLDAPAEARTRRAMEVTGIDEKTARRRLEAVDSARRIYVRRLYGVELGDPGLYDLVLDTSTLGVETCVERILAALRGLPPPGKGR